MIKEGSPAWAILQLRAGKRLRKTIWAKAHVRLEAGALIASLGDGMEMAVTEDWLALDFGEGWQWEEDLPRRYAFVSSTLLDLRVMPDEITVGQLNEAITRCRTHGKGDYTPVILSAWEAVGRPEIGKRILALLNSMDGNLAVMAARQNFDKAALPNLLTALDALRKEGGA